MKEPKPVKPSMSAARRLRIFTRDGGICEICKAKVKAGEPYDIDHRIAWAIGYDDSDDNLRTVHKACHRDAGTKTASDLKTLAKIKRIEARHNGTRRERKPIPSRPFDKPNKPFKWPSRPFGETKK